MIGQYVTVHEDVISKDLISRVSEDISETSNNTTLKKLKSNPIYS